ncbi:MAG: tachylectin-related carbohydrate-binding protein [Acidobacteriota bacterium]|nr:tachylectin-related carbohydrate-binding protein [Acidobacteriota bacterium]
MQSLILPNLVLLLCAVALLAEPPNAQLRPFAPGGIAIDWDHANDDASGSTLERENPPFTWVFSVLSNSINDLGLQPSHTYRYRVCAIYGQTPDCTPWLAAQTFATPPPPTGSGVPTFTGSSASSNSITVNWTSPGGYSFFNVRWAEDGHPDGQNEVRGGSFTAGGLRPGAYHFIIQGCNTTLLGSSCGHYSAPFGVSTRVPPPPPPVVPQMSKGVIYGVTLNDDLLWYRHDGRTDGTFRWAFPEGRKIGVGWNVRKIFGSAGVVYTVADNGDLNWYRHLGREDGSFRWEGPKTVGKGWGEMREVFSGGDGIIYAISPVVPASLATGIGPGMGRRPASGGDLMWYRHVGQQDGSFRWEGPKKVGTGWSGLTKVFSGGDGIVYGILENGDLMWYRHLGRGDGTFRWEGPKKVGAGWGSVVKVFSGEDGVIYAAQDNGDLMWYRHDGRNDGSFRWASNAGKKVGSGWYKFTLKQVFTD